MTDGENVQLLRISNLLCMKFWSKNK